MFTSRALGRFLGPWLAFAALSGVGGGLMFGLCGTVGGISAGLIMLWSGITEGVFFKAITAIAQSFSYFAEIVIFLVASGFIGGFLTGLVSSLIGKGEGYVWGFVSFVGVAFVLSSFVDTRAFVESFLLLLMSLGTFGALLPNKLLAQEENYPEWQEPIRDWLQTTWLTNPSAMMRIGGIALPIFLGVGIDVVMTAPVYASHQNYAARLGIWETWGRSRYFARMSNYPRRSSCQSNLKQIMLGVKQYIQDYDEFYPTRPSRPEDGAAAALYPYLKSTYIFQCPAEFYRYESSASPQKTDWQSGDFNDYWINARTYGLNEANFTNESNAVTWGDGNTGAGEGTAAYSLSNLPPAFAPATRHLNGANYAFADGHVKWLTPRAISNTAPPLGRIYTLVP